MFENLDPRFRVMAWPGREYVLGTDAAKTGLVARLGDGRWRVTCHDALACQSRVLSETATGRFTFDSPSSRAALFHFKKRSH